MAITFERDSRETKVRDILNAAWNPRAIETLWDIVLELDKEAPEKANYPQKAAILDLLACVNARHDGCEVGDLIKAKFDSLFKLIAQNNRQWTPEFRSKLHQAAVRSIAEYGSPKLLGPGFWQCLEDPENGFVTLRALSKVADKDALQKLKEFEKTCKWPEEAKTLLKDLIAEIETRLAQSK